MAADGGESGVGPDDESTVAHEPDVEDDERLRGTGRHPDAPPPAARDRQFGWRGWMLVGTMIVAFVVVPALLYFLPRAGGVAGSLGLSLRDAYLVLPLVPALVLAVLAVWATTRP